MRSLHSPIILICLLSSCSTAFAFRTVGLKPVNGDVASISSGAGITSTGFEENKGQVRTTEGEAAPFVRYRLSQGNTQLFLLENGIAYQFSRMHYPEGYVELMADKRGDLEKQEQMNALRDEVRLETFRMNMVLEGADMNARISTEGRSSDYTQYYNHDALDVHTYSKVTYHEVYPGIDWVVYTTETGMKYDFVVRPGADPDRIRLRFEHHEELSVDADGNLIHGNHMGRFTEEKPVSFQDGKEVPTSFVLEGNTLRFALGNYDRGETVTIDPARIWATYYGESLLESGNGCVTDASGNVYMSGTARSTSAIAANGHQNTIGGGIGGDAFLVKFNSSGQRLWGTYYGGENSDGGSSCAVDGSGNVYLAGSTGSTTGIAIGGHQNTMDGTEYDSFLVKFNSAGTRLWATYYGGPGNDGGTACAVDGSDNVYLAGLTIGSQTGIASGGHQNIAGGVSDDFIVKFNSAGVRLWATYYGGESDEGNPTCAVDASGNVYLGGITRSTTGIAQAGHQMALSGPPLGEGYDAYLVKFNSAGVRQWGTYYGGPGDDAASACAVDGIGNVYMAGQTRSATGIAQGGHQNAYVDGTGGGSPDGFLVKFNSAGLRQWGTYYGGPESDGSSTCAVDENDNVYLGGSTASTSGIAEGGFQNTMDAFGSGYLAKFSPAGTRIWGTYYGGENVDAVFSCAVDPEGDVYIAGYTSSTTDIAESGHQNTFGGGFGQNAKDAFLVKFAGRTITTGNINGPSCTAQAVSVPFTVSSAFNAGNTFTAQLSNASGSFASPVVIGTLSGTTSGSISASIPLGTAPGAGYRIRVVGSSPLVVGTDHGTNLTINDRNTSCSCADVPETETNNSAGTADPIAYDTPMSGITGPCSLLDNSADHFSFTATSQGALRVDACLSNTGPAPLSVTFRVVNTAGTTLGSFILPAGANNLPTPGSFLFPCLGIGSYRIVVDDPSTVHCTNYAFSYTILPPVFGPDPEPNDGGSQATPVAYDTDQDGRANFDGESTYDYFSITTPANGVFNIEIQAEHGGAQPGTMDVQLSFSGVNVQSWTVPIGSLSVPVASTVSIPCRSVGANYLVRISSSVCGASYRWKYTITPPHFGNDMEPNNTLPTAIVLPQATPAEGQLNFIVFNNPENTDFYRIDLPVAGTISVSVEAEHVGASTIETIATSIVTSAGSTLATFNGAIGANSTPASSTFGLPCLSSTSPYYIKLEGGICGVSYRVSWTMVPPVFATDPEPNNGGSQATPVNYNTFQEGQIGFLGDNGDYYEITPTLQGIMRIEVQAEHGGDTPGTMDVGLLYSGVPIIVETIPVGANGQPITTIVSVPCRGSSTHDVLFDAASACGTSYRWRYYTSDPYFANDVEPNNTVAASILLPANTYATGQLNFHYGVSGTGADNTDVHRMDLSADGVLNVTIEAEHTGASPTETIQVLVKNGAGVTLATWNGSIGANSVPALSTFSLPCRGSTIPYYLWLSGGTCGVSYRVSWNVTPAYFANDAEPNNSAATAIPLDLSTSWYDGHIGFYNTTDDDLYVFSHPGGAWSAAVSAEHASTGEGSLTMVVRTLSGVVVSTFTVPAGGSSTPLTNTFTIPALNAASYRIFMSDVTCGVSYRIHCVIDADNDGVCDANDLCASGPEPGMPCDDGNANTVNDAIDSNCQCTGDFTTGLTANDAGITDLRMWPNPATDEVWLEVGKGSSGPAMVVVRDLLGRSIAELGAIAVTEKGTCVIHLGHLAQGTYILDVTVGGKRWSARFVKA